MSEQPDTIHLHASALEAGVRLDAFLADKIDGWSRSRLQRLIDDGVVLVNDKAAKASYKIREGDKIEVELTELPVATFEPEDIPLDIVFEDEYLAVINKQAGMVVHPGAGVSSGTLANAIAWHFGLKSSPPYKGGVDAALGGRGGSPLSEPPASAGDEAPMQKPACEQGRNRDDEHYALTNVRASANEHRVGIVHRLDKDTSGLIVVAKNEEVHEALSEQFHSRKVFKSYVALVHGLMRENSGTIDRPIARDRWHRTKMAVSANGRSALSLWKVRQRFEKFTLLDVEIKTGRTHQIRVHLASINHPVVGDETYNEGRDNTIANVDIKKAVDELGRFFLHAERLAFTHPKSGERLTFTSKLPAELEDVLRILV